MSWLIKKRQSMKEMTDEHLHNKCTTEFSALVTNKRRLKPIMNHLNHYMKSLGYGGRWESFYCNTCRGHHGRRHMLHVHIVSEFEIELREKEKGLINE